MKKTLLIIITTIVVTLGVLIALLWGFGTYQINETKKIILDVTNMKDCEVDKTHKKDSNMVTQDGEKIYFIQGLMQCEQDKNILIEMQYVKNRAREKQGLKITKSTGEYNKSGIWYR